MTFIRYSCEGCKQEVICDPNLDFDTYSPRLSFTDFAGRVVISSLVYKCPEKEDRLFIQPIDQQQALNFLIAGTVSVSAEVCSEYKPQLDSEVIISRDGSIKYL